MGSVDGEHTTGRILGCYTLKRLLGRGGMGEVFEAVDTRLERTVAVKLLPPAATGPLERARLVREARAAARLNHPNVVTVFAIEEEADQLFIAMELVPGGSVAAALARAGHFLWPEATRVMIDACRGVATAHRAGLVHRDLKPGNLLLAADGTVKVADFGVARGLGSETTALTDATMIVGTAEYMSPEQCRGDEPVTDLSDVYALGATYYALLTGHPPFERPTAVQLQFAHCSAPVPDPRALVADVPETCAELVKRALAKEPADRYPSADAMRAALEATLRAEQAQPTSIPAPDYPRRLSRRALVLTTLGGLAMGGTGVAVWRWPRTPPVGPSDPNSPPDDFVSLFDGESLNGWFEFIARREPAWVVRDRHLIGTGPNRYLFTERRDYKNFHLRVVGKVFAQQNSGVYLRCTPMHSLPFGYEAQLGWSEGHPEFGRIYPNPAGHGGKMTNRTPRYVKPNTEFILEVVAIDRRIVTRIDGDEVDALDVPEVTIGHIGLQAANAGACAAFRQIQIWELP